MNQGSVFIKYRHLERGWIQGFRTTHMGQCAEKKEEAGPSQASFSIHRISLSPTPE